MAKLTQSKTKQFHVVPLLPSGPLLLRAQSHLRGQPCVGALSGVQQSLTGTRFGGGEK